MKFCLGRGRWWFMVAQPAWQSRSNKTGGSALILKMAPNKKINDNINNYKLTIRIILILICFVDFFFC